MPGVNTRSFVRSAAVPLTIGLLIIGALIAVVFLSASVGNQELPPEAPPFVTPEPPAFSAVDVKQRSGDGFIVTTQTSSGTAEEEVTVAESVVIERLTLITAESVQPGDWLTVVGIPNAVKNFSVHSMVVIPGGGTPAEDGIARTPAGFSGHEAARDPRDRPVLGGVVLRIEGNTIYLQGPTSEIAVIAGPEAPARLFRIEPVSVDDIGEGDRIGGFFGSTVEALLVLPGGATG